MILEIIITIVVIIAIMVFVGVPVVSILSMLIVLLSGLLLLAAALFVLFFIVTDLILLFYRRAEGTFSHINDSTRFERAVYLVGSEEYTCVFPAESIARRQIYEKPQHRIWIPRSGKRRRAYDRHSLFVIAIGNLFSVILTAAAIFVAVRFQWI